MIKLLKKWHWLHDWGEWEDDWVWGDDREEEHIWYRACKKYDCHASQVKEYIEGKKP